MSRMMPPTPVAAPWYGSMNDGWLCDSILKTAASRRRCRPRRRSRRAPAGRAARGSAASSGGSASSCSCSAPTTSPRRCRARSASARDRASGRCGRIRRGSRPWRSSSAGSVWSSFGTRDRDSDELEARCAQDIPGCCPCRLRRHARSSAPARSDDTTDSKRTRPSALPSTVSHARSGCGIRPTTLRFVLQMPAMLSMRCRSDSAASVIWPGGVAVPEDDALGCFEARG